MNRNRPEAGERLLSLDCPEAMRLLQDQPWQRPVEELVEAKSASRGLDLRSALESCIGNRYSDSLIIEAALGLLDGNSPDDMREALRKNMCNLGIAPGLADRASRFYLDTLPDGVVGLLHKNFGPDYVDNLRCRGLFNQIP